VCQGDDVTRVKTTTQQSHVTMTMMIYYTAAQVAALDLLPGQPGQVTAGIPDDWST